MDLMDSAASIKATRSEVELACALIRMLDGYSIEQAKNALMRAQRLLDSTQIVSANSALLAVKSENATALQNG
jgi:hypothetical protein